MRHAILLGFLVFVVGCGTQDDEFLDRRIAVATLHSVLDNSDSVLVTLADAKGLLGTALMMALEGGPTADSMTIREIIAWHSAWADEMRKDEK